MGGSATTNINTNNVVETNVKNHQIYNSNNTHDYNLNNYSSDINNGDVTLRDKNSLVNSYNAPGAIICFGAGCSLMNL